MCLPVGVAIVVHDYLWARLVRDVGLAPTAALTLKAPPTRLGVPPEITQLVLRTQDDV